MQCAAPTPRLDAQGPGCSDATREGGRPPKPSGGTGSSASDLPAGVGEGEIVAGKYRIGAVIGAGAMGTVVSAHHLLFDEKVAIKFLLPEALGHAEAVARFLREARAAVRIKSEHVARVFDVATLDSGAPYIVMEYLEGCDLAGWLRARGALEVEQAVDFILQACDAIAEAHALPVIHRDIKPANLFAVQRGGVVQSIKVLDFGISKTERLISATLSPEEARVASVITQQRAIIGSPVYMSPEQMESARDVDARTDIWALGVTLCELVMGKLPFEGTTLVQVYSRITSGLPLRLRESAPHLPPGLEAVLVKCLQKNRRDRYASVGDLAGALAPFGSSLAATYVQRIARHARALDLTPGEKSSVASPSPRTLASQVTDTLSSPSPSPSPSTRRGLAVVIALAAIATTGAAAVTIVGRRSPPLERTPSPLVPGTEPPTATRAPVVDRPPASSAPSGASARDAAPPIASIAPPARTAPPRARPQPSAALTATGTSPVPSAPRPSGTDWRPPSTPK
jgi:eukaryotic-like serine/threonine-protein kinase